ncbi:SpnB-like Rossmann fold domain-containing protein, partial [Streptomyces sp. MMG1121]|uniref:SpnB-like Rossmann fold domain-containing protein n=1 Tax=Streptomyces sp. MMG1121 TaxID=1415544 RepID=UPI0006C6CD00
GTAFVELAIRAGDEVGCDRIDELTLETPLVLPDNGGVQIHVSVGSPEPSGERSLTVYSRTEDAPADQPWTRHAAGVLGTGTPSALAPGDSPWPPAGATRVDLDGLYQGLDEAGLRYGPLFQGLTAAWRQNDSVFAEIRLPEGADATGFGVHPALLDAALHAMSLTGIGYEPGRVLLPFAWGGVYLHGTGARALRVRIDRTGSDSVSLTATDDSGRPVISIGSLVLRAVSADQLRASRPVAGESLYQLDWTPVPVPEAVGIQGSWAFLDSRAESVCAGLVADRFPDVNALAQAVSSGAPAPDAVIVPFLDERGDAVAAVRAATGRALLLLQKWLAEDALGSSRLVIVTRGAVAIGEHEDVQDLAAAAVWGLVRSAQSENPGRFVLVDIDDVEPSHAALSAALDTNEPQLALRAGEMNAPRLARTGDGGTLTIPAGESAWRLDAPTKGTFEDLALVPNPEANEPLEPGQVRISVRATGLNFRDVILTLGMLPGQDGLGSEGAGVVVEVGSGVVDLCPGDRVMGLFAGFV